MQASNFAQLLERARCGDTESVEHIVVMLEPALRKLPAMVADDDSYSELVEWLLKAVKKYPDAPIRRQCRYLLELCRGVPVDASVALKQGAFFRTRAPVRPCMRRAVVPHRAHRLEQQRWSNPMQRWGSTYLLSTISRRRQTCSHLPTSHVP